MSQCYPTLSCMCKNGTYQNCDLNLFNFFFILCLYYNLYQAQNITAWLVNLPVILITLPFVPVSLVLYLFYLMALPLGDLMNIFFPSLSVVIIPTIIFFLVGISNVRLSKLFKVRK